MIRFAVFDLDGTLLDSLPDLTDAVNFALDRENLPEHTEEEVRSYIGSGVFVLLEKAAYPHSEPELLKRLKEGFDEYYSVHYCDRSKLYPGIRSLLSQLKEQGIQLAVFSNKPDEFVKKIVGELFEKETFIGIMGNRKEYPKKPDPAQLKELQMQLGYKDEECLYVGDSDVDILTGKNANYQTVGVTWGYRSKELLLETGAEFLAETADKLMELIKQFH